jgi:cell division protein FtsI/penicillin-binding protein 2
MDGDPVRALKLSPVALAAVKEGMIAVVNSPAGTGVEPKRDDMVVAAKTGSAQAPKFSIPLRDPQTGEFLREKLPDGVTAKGRVLRRTFEPGELPWYEGVGENHQHLAHVWFIGYAPADHPKIAFCVFVEYGGSGGKMAGAIARELIEACVRHKYLSPQPSGGLAAGR